MIVNGLSLLRAAPIKDMADRKVIENGVSYGLTEAGYDVRVKQKVVLGPYQRFLLVSTVEEFQMPDNLLGIVHDKSTHARRGMAVQNTVIEPGWRGFLTLELTLHDNTSTLEIPAGAGIAQIIFHELLEARAYSGKYQDQEDRPVNAIYEAVYTHSP